MISPSSELDVLGPVEPWRDGNWTLRVQEHTCDVVIADGVASEPVCTDGATLDFGFHLSRFRMFAAPEAFPVEVSVDDETVFSEQVVSDVTQLGSKRCGPYSVGYASVDVEPFVR